jgi:preprotein translocase, SecE subunit, bacterial
MATKTAIERGDNRQEPGALSEFGGNAMGWWKNFTSFLTDVRAEMRKVVAPSRKEVQVTTSVVIVAVFIFGLFFFIVDWAFNIGIHQLLSKLGGLQ